MFLFYIVFIALLFPVCTEAENLLKNPGFESAVQNWEIPSGKAPGPRYDIDKEVRYAATSSLSWKSAENNGYLMVFQKVPLKAGRMYRLSAWVKTKNLVGARESGATICMGFLDENGKHINGGPHPGGIKGTTDWRQITAYAGPILPEIKEGSVTCYVRKGRKKSFTGEAWWDQISLEVVPFFCRILKPSFKKTFMGEKNILELEFEIYPEDYEKEITDMVVSVEVCDVEDKVVFARKFVPEKRIEVKNFTIDSLKSGHYLLKTSLEAKSGEQLWHSEQKLNKAPENSNPTVYIDQHHRTIVEGKSFFPLGVYLRTAAWTTNGVKLSEQLELLKDSGFNCFVCYDALTKVEMDACEKAGIKVIYSLSIHFSQIFYHPPRINSDLDEVPQLLKVVNRWKNHPALLAWYINDERGPELLNNLQAHYDAINTADPNHPSWGLHNKPYEMTPMINNCDIIGVDEYPVPQHKISRVTDAVKNTLEATRKSRALWAVPQIANLGVHYGSKMPDARPPSLVEMRNMAWQAICGGSNGLIFYCLHDCFRDKKFPFEQTWPNIRQMSLEVKSYESILSSIESVPEIKFKASASLNWIAKSLDGILYLFVVNTGENAEIAEFTVFDKIDSVERINIGKDKNLQKIEHNTHSWKDEFAKNDVHVYTIKLK